MGKVSLFDRIFGKSKDGKEPSPQEAIGRLRDVEDMLMKKTELLESKIGDELKKAKQYGTKNKRGALAALKRKKRYESQLNQIDGTLATLEYQRDCLENANSNAEVLKAMQQGAKALKGAHKELGDVDNVHELMDDIQEQHTMVEEINNAISNPMNMGIDADEDELLAELEEMEQEEINKKMLGVADNVTDPLPSVPASEPVKAKSQVDQDLEDLKNWATG
ncbi:hypothetical protein SNEBB_001029 [Seison nebaliae]|nr:hypothetical protein SNEBB_001029 [Seison nebaliae]